MGQLYKVMSSLVGVRLFGCSVCRYLGLKHSWSQEKTVNYLVKRLANEKAEALLDVCICIVSNLDPLPKRKGGSGEYSTFLYLLIIWSGTI